MLPKMFFLVELSVISQLILQPYIVLIMAELLLYHIHHKNYFRLTIHLFSSTSLDFKSIVFSHSFIDCILFSASHEQITVKTSMKKFPIFLNIFLIFIITSY